MEGTLRKARTPDAKPLAKAGDDHLRDPLRDTLAGAPPVQLDASVAPAGDVAGTAAKSVAGTGGPLPHLDRIQSSFGHHDVSDVTAHRDGHATEALDGLDAKGLATGRSVALATDDLHTVAHEAAHTVQQEHGVALDRGVGAPGDSYERHADQVADKVVRGESAEALLDTATKGAPTVQRKAIQFSYNAASGQYEDRPKKPDSLKGGDEVRDPLTAHHLYPWNKIRTDLNGALTEKSKDKMERLLVWAETTLPDSFWDDLAKEPNARSSKFGDQVNMLAAKVCWSPSNIFMGPLNTKRADDPNEGLDTAFAKRGMATPASALGELMNKRGGIGNVGNDKQGPATIGKDKEKPTGTLTEILMRNVRDASEGQARPYDKREWGDAPDDKRVRRGQVPLKESDDPNWKPSTKKFSTEDVDDKPQAEPKKTMGEDEIQRLRKEAEERRLAAQSAPKPDTTQDDDDGPIGGSMFD